MHAKKYVHIERVNNLLYCCEWKVGMSIQCIEKGKVMLCLACLSLKLDEGDVKYMLRRNCVRI